MRVGRRARIGGLSFVEWPDDHHGEWLVLDADGIQSVWGGVDVRREEVVRPAAHGSFDLPGYLAPRVIAISGHMSAPNPERLEHLTARLTGLLAFGESERLVVDGPMGERWCDVRLGSATQVTQLDHTTARFLLTLWAPNPRMYGRVRDFPAGVPAFHYGNFPANPELIVTGPKSGGYTITGPGGRQYIVSQDLAAGQTHTIDMLTGWLYLDGSLQSGAVVQARTWGIPSGSSGAVHTITGSTGSLTVRVTDTFV